MSRLKLNVILIFSLSVLLLNCTQRERPLILENQLELKPVNVSSYSELVEIPIQNVDLTDGFWKEKFELVKNVTIPNMFEYMHADTSSHYRNFLIAAGEIKGGWYGRPWNDGDFYKWLEALVYAYQVTKDPEMDNLMDIVIDVIGEVQEPDGYISTYIQLNNKKRFQNKQNHELYNMGHLMTVAARHYEATGKTNLLNIGIKTADYLYQTFAVNRPARLNPFGFNPSNIMGAVDIYRVTGYPEYLALADTFVSMRGTTKLGETIDMKEYLKHSNPPGDDNNQDRVPFRKETEAVGHAVTAEYLYCGAADLFMETEDSTLWEANKRIWEDVTNRKLSIHGGPGPVARGASIRGDNVHEAFDAAYSLPLRDSYHETCANIANIMWNWRLYKISPDVKYLDIMERGIYGSGLSGIGLDGFSFYYNNPLRRFDKEYSKSLGVRSDKYQRSPHLRGYCCPPQLARHIAGFRKYLYSVSKDKPELWINFFASSKVTARLSNSTIITLTQKTSYPMEGDVEVKINVEQPSTFELKIPVPAWATGVTASINGEIISSVVPGKFLSIQRKWNDNDRVSIHLPMRIRFIKANPLVDQTRNQVAVIRGPVVYCLESIDLPKNMRIADIVLKKEAKYIVEFVPELLGGIYALKTKALGINDKEWSLDYYNTLSLYKEVEDEKVSEVEIQLIPYYTWSNRGLSEMTVWMPFTYR